MSEAGQQELIVGRMQNPAVALGLSVTAMVRDAALANLRFGAISRMLIGQINRGHYLLAMKADSEEGMVGWMPVRAEDAERWLDFDEDVPNAPDTETDAVALNIITYRNRRALDALVAGMKTEFAGFRHLYAKRVYADGRVRPVRMPIGAHIADFAAQLPESSR